MELTIKRGDIFYADLSPVVGSEQGGVRPILIVQNNVGNKYSPTIIASAAGNNYTVVFITAYVFLVLCGIVGLLIPELGEKGKLAQSRK